MVAVSIHEINIHQTMDWLYAIEEACHWERNNKTKALAALKAVLHELRALLPLEFASQLSALLPLDIRGIFFENWHPRFVPDHEIRKEDFLNAIAVSLYPYQDMDLEETAKGVFQVLNERLPIGEFGSIMRNTPKSVQELYEENLTRVL
ncbi:MAG: DUF2267 domain-containing protein [Alphaproteobacteria bacterium]|jgi:uncharacterized protein (DUF2267 family)|nr:DUF2267 domain-containing protein [Alphaproteobacteria bacterium]